MYVASMRNIRKMVSVAFDELGKIRDTFYLLNNAKSDCHRITASLPPYVLERIALMRIQRGDYTDTPTGRWIGKQHLIIYLSMDEYKEIRSAINGNTGKPRKRRSKTGTEATQLVLFHAPDERVRGVRGT